MPDARPEPAHGAADDPRCGVDLRSAHPGDHQVTVYTRVVGKDGRVTDVQGSVQGPAILISTSPAKVLPSIAKRFTGPEPQRQGRSPVESGDIIIVKYALLHLGLTRDRRLFSGVHALQAPVRRLRPRRAVRDKGDR